MKSCPHCPATFRNGGGLHDHIVKQHNGVLSDDTVLMSSAKCPGCGEANDAATNLNRLQRPAPGDFSICATCGYLQIFTDDLTLRQPTRAEKVEMANDPRLLRMQRTVRDV